MSLSNHFLKNQEMRNRHIILFDLKRNSNYSITINIKFHFRTLRTIQPPIWQRWKDTLASFSCLYRMVPFLCSRSVTHISLYHATVGPRHYHLKCCYPLSSWDLKWRERLWAHIHRHSKILTPTKENDVITTSSVFFFLNTFAGSVCGIQPRKVACLYYGLIWGTLS